MANGQEVTITLTVEGAQRGATDIAQVDRELNIVGQSATRTGAAFRRMAGAMPVGQFGARRALFSLRHV